MKKQPNSKLLALCLLAVFIALELVMKLTGIGLIPLGGLSISFLTVPVALGAMLLGVWQGTVLGACFGLLSFLDAVKGVGGLSTALFAVNPFSAFLLCVGTRTLMGLLTGLAFKGLQKIDRTQIVCYFGGALAAPLLNTILFMGYIVLFFYQTEAVQNLVAQKGAVNPISFVVLLVGVQALVEAAVCCFVGGAVGKGVSKALHLNEPVFGKKLTKKAS